MRKLLDELFADDVVTVFVDDSTLQRSQVRALQSDCDTWTAIAFSRGCYPRFHERVRPGLGILIDSGRELHAMEIVRGGADTPWGACSVSHRRSVLNAAAVALVAAVRKVYFVASEHHRYRAALAGMRARNLPDWAHLSSPKDGGWFMALHVLLWRLRADFPGSRFVLVSDSGRLQDKVHRILEPNSDVFEDAVFYVDSRALPGLQFADLAAYAHARNVHRYQRRLDGKGPPTNRWAGWRATGIGKHPLVRQNDAFANVDRASSNLIVLARTRPVLRLSHG